MKIKQLFSTIMTLALCLSFYSAASAEKDAIARVPVTLTADKMCRAINVSIPTVFPIEVNKGTVFTADNACIINNGKAGAIQVTGISVTDGAYEVTDFNDFSGHKAIALDINGCTTRDSGELKLTETAFPEIDPGKKLALAYDAKVSGDVSDISDVQASYVTITISIVD